MILAKLAELAMCRISGEEEVKKTRGAPAPGAPLFPTPVYIIDRPSYEVFKCHSTSLE